MEGAGEVKSLQLSESDNGVGCHAHNRTFKGGIDPFVKCTNYPNAQSVIFYRTIVRKDLIIPAQYGNITVAK